MSDEQKNNRRKNSAEEIENSSLVELAGGDPLMENSDMGQNTEFRVKPSLERVAGQELKESTDPYKENKNNKGEES